MSPQSTFTNNNHTMATPQSAYKTLSDHYTTSNPHSQTLYNKATQSLPGGNTRSVLYYAPFPLSITRASGSRLHDADGHTYTDLLGEYTAGLYGHSNPKLLSAITRASQRGLSYGSHHEDEAILAGLIRDRFPSIELLRFTNSGTEATLMALAVAKVHTCKSKILVFANAYHGGAFAFGGGRSSVVNAPHEYLIATYNDLESVRALVRDPRNEKDIAAIIVEPMLGSGGCIPARKDFLIGLRAFANKVGAVLIYDEVMTSRLFAGGGIQSQLPSNMRPDMTTLGKYIGGGLSFGAFGGSKEIMSRFDPRRADALPHAGTFNNNVLTMAAGRVGLEEVFTPAVAEELHARGEALRKRLNDVGRGTSMRVTGCGSIMCFHFIRGSSSEEAVKSHLDLADADATLGGLLHLFLLEKGHYIARRGFLALSLALSDAELDGFVEAVRDFVEVYNSFLVAHDSRESKL